MEDCDFPDHSFKGFRGGFTQSQFRFMENDLRLVDTGRLVVFAVHVPLQNQAVNAFREEDRARMLRLLQKFPHVLILCAHSHNQRQDFFDKEYGWTNPRLL